MHDLGTDNAKIKDLIIERENKIYELSKKLNDTIIFVVADHGHLNEEDIFLKDYPDILKCLKYHYPVTARFDCQLFRLIFFQCTVLLCKKPAHSARLGLIPLTLQIPAYNSWCYKSLLNITSTDLCLYFL